MDPSKKQRCKKNREVTWQRKDNYRNDEIDFYVHPRPVCGDSFNFRERAGYHRVDSEDERYWGSEKKKKSDEVKMKK